MIGGKDIYVDVPHGAPAMDFAARAIRLFWPTALFQNANTADPPTEYEKLDFSRLPELFAYKTRQAADAWDALGADPSLDGTMIHLLAAKDQLTIVVDNHPSSEIQAIVQTIVNVIKTRFPLQVH